MNLEQEREAQSLKKCADDNGVAIIVVDERRRTISVSNNNSICRNLSGSDEFAPRCAEFCGRAFEWAEKAGKAVEYECYAGLNCTAVPVEFEGKQRVAIIGRVFLKAEKYREATLKAISGEWRGFRPTDFFSNILIAGSGDKLRKIAEKLFKRVPEARTISESLLDLPAKAAVPSEKQQKEISARRSESEELARLIEKFNRGTTEEKPAAKRASAESMAAWRSLFGSMMKLDYESAVNAILQFLERQYDIRSIVWLERRGDMLEAAFGIGEMSEKRLKIGISADNPRLADAIRNETPIELKEKRTNSGVETPARTMLLFPSAVGGEVRGAFAIADELNNKKKRIDIARITNMVATQLEVLRLRDEVSHQDLMSRTVQRFNENLRSIDSNDYWLKLTQLSAELIQAERASLLVRNERTNDLKLRAAVGSRVDLFADPHVGERIARNVLEAGRPVVVPDMGRMNIEPSPAEWKYKTSSFLSFPIIIEDKQVAVMNFTDKADGSAFGKADLDLLKAVAPQVAVAIDRVSLKEHAGELEQLSVTDGLTGLLNRRYIEERLDEEINRSQRHGYPMSFLMLDVDNFKAYNDSFGHQAGDAALKIVADVIRDSLRTEDVAARYGGEEFSVLLPQTSGEEARAIAERIRERFALTDFPSRRVTVSIGIATFSDEFQTPESVIWAADQALYAAKRAGRNNVQTFDGSIDPMSEHLH